MEVVTLTSVAVCKRTFVFVNVAVNVSMWPTVSVTGLMDVAVETNVTDSVRVEVVGRRRFVVVMTAVISRVSTLRLTTVSTRVLVKIVGLDMIDVMIIGVVIVFSLVIVLSLTLVKMVLLKRVEVAVAVT